MGEVIFRSTRLGSIFNLISHLEYFKFRHIEYLEASELKQKVQVMVPNFWKPTLLVPVVVYRI